MEQIVGPKKETAEEKGLSPSPDCVVSVQALQTNMWAVLGCPLGQLGV